MNVEKDIFEGETFREDVQEEMEFYDMNQFEGKLMKRLAVLEEKLDAVMEEVEDNNHRLKGIQFQFTRALIIRLVKWAVLLGFLWWLYNSFIGPVVTKVGDTYYQIDSTLNRFDSVNNSTESFGQTVDRLFPDAGNVLNKLRPGSATTSEE